MYRFIYFIFQFFGFCFSISSELQKIPIFEIKNLSDTSPTLLYIYFERPDYKCPYCDIYSDYISKLNFPGTKRLNYFDNPFLASKFLVFRFPALIIYFKENCYFIEIKSYEELERIISNSEWLNYNPVNSFINPNSLFSLIFSYSMWLFFLIFKKIIFFIDLIPTVVFSIFFGILGGYVAYTTIKIFKEDEVAVKED
ncbi:hypothetical protein CWI38_1463p0030 [Hamiltosporidium tvaerminnensis]|uniref:Thioredoxin domain-containing protein n=3 Tax=Hamiltosporidium TaxID=1176354 RepID=A0A4V2JVG0_9MICR|nr:hypothetical protein CWI36_0835p0020 [Hamiltosporidium magnivora]TBU10948.1 hypothetical protein CWI38_1463p0030 [Hamiltosporidium tvaerminnensis]